LSDESFGDIIPTLPPLLENIFDPSYVNTACTDEQAKEAVIPAAFRSSRTDEDYLFRCIDLDPNFTNNGSMVPYLKTTYIYRSQQQFLGIEVVVSNGETEMNTILQPFDVWQEPR
jgi:hypothetical protein